MKKLILGVTAGAAFIVAVQLAAQAPPRGRANKQPAPTPAGGGGGYANAYPQRNPDPAAVARGKPIYDVNCALCHGDDARGGDMGPNLIRADVVMNDKDGELIGAVLEAGRLAQGMPKFEFTPAQTSDIAAFLHSFRVSGYDNSRNRPESVVVGDASAGGVYFRSKCASCHSATGDLSGIGSRITDGRTLQQRWLMPAGGGRGGRGAGPAPTLATVTLASGQKVEGRLGRIDDFVVTLTDADGTERSFRRDGDTPKVELRDPLEGHKALLPVYTDKNIHDVTAYLVTLK